MKRYPHKAPADVLGDLVETTPGDEGKWFAAAKDAELFDDAISLARRTPCNPKTLANAARDHATTQPAFAVNAGLLALHYLAQGFGYEITGADVLTAYDATICAAEQMAAKVGRDVVAEAREQIRKALAVDSPSAEFMRRFIGKRVGL